MRFFDIQEKKRRPSRAKASIFAAEDQKISLSKWRLHYFNDTKD